MKYKKFPSFEFLYMLLMIIYMGQMTSETSRMIQVFSFDLAFLLPIIATVILLIKNPISFQNMRLAQIVVLMMIWSILISIKYEAYHSNDLSYLFFIFYSIIIAYVHVNVFGKTLFIYYEEIVSLLSIISVILWGIKLIMPPIEGFFETFPKTTFGYNFLYIFNSMRSGVQTYYGMSRNAGFSWEPGRFAVFICLALYFNLSRNGLTFKKNKQLIWLLVALVSTMSTTGYVIAITIWATFYIKRFSMNGLMKSFLVIIIVGGLMQFDFMLSKIQDRANLKQKNEDFMVSADYHNSVDEEGKRIHSLDRFQSMQFDVMNVENDPVLGYGMNRTHSWFYNSLSSNFTLTGGLAKLFAQLGVPLALVLYVVLFYSSIKISSLFKYKHKYLFFIIMIFASISYPWFCIPIITAFWFYGIFESV